MDISWLTEPQTWIGFATLLILEVVLGIDNLVFVAILAGKVKPAQRDRARITGLGLAVVIRMFMLAGMAHVITLTQPLFSLGAHAVSGKDLIMLCGGIFLLYKATTELHERLEGENHFQAVDTQKKHAAFWGVVVQIFILDAVFSIDSVITAVGMAQHLPVMILAVIIAVGVMMLASGAIARFVDANPTIKILALAFLILVGVSLIADGLGFHIPKGYIYFSMAFSLLVELINIQIRKKSAAK